MPARIIPFPQELRPTLPTIVGNVDYLMLRQRLEQIDALLLASGLETDFVQRALAGLAEPGQRPTQRPPAAALSTALTPGLALQPLAHPAPGGLSGLQLPVGGQSALSMVRGLVGSRLHIPQLRFSQER